jgi:hypothetical protein
MYSPLADGNRKHSRNAVVFYINKENEQSPNKLARPRITSGG